MTTTARSRRLAQAAFGVALMFVALLMDVPPSRAATFTVTNLNAGGAGSLNQAIIDANATANVGGVPDVIEFAVAGEIAVAEDLEPITESVIIDGFTAPGY